MDTTRSRPRLLAAAALSVALVIAALGGVVVARGRLEGAVGEITAASTEWLWLGSAGFALALAASGLAWHAALRSCGGTAGRTDAVCRYLSGSLVNSLLPGRLGGPVRVALFSRTVDSECSVLTTAGAAAAVGAARAVWSVVLVAAGAGLGVVPLWPVALFGVAVIAAGAVAVLSRHVAWRGRVAHVVDAFQAMGREPLVALRLVGWTGLAQVARIGAATALMAAFEVSQPLGAALLVLPAVGLAGALPLMPGNLGIASAAVAVALGSRGVPADVALAAGIGYGAVEMLTSLGAGAVGALALVQRPGASRRLAAGAALAGCLALGGAFGVTVILPAVQVAVG